MARARKTKNTANTANRAAKAKPKRKPRHKIKRTPSAATVDMRSEPLLPPDRLQAVRDLSLEIYVGVGLPKHEPKSKVQSPWLHRILRFMAVGFVVLLFALAGMNYLGSHYVAGLPPGDPTRVKFCDFLAIQEVIFRIGPSIFIHRAGCTGGQSSVFPR